MKLLSNILVLFFLIILAVPAYWVARGKVEPERSLMEYRTLSTFPRLSFPNFKTATKRLLQFKFNDAGTKFFSQFINLKYQHAFERAVSEQFPFRAQFIQLSRTVDRQVIRAAYAFLDDPAIPADTTSGIYFKQDPKVLFYGPRRFGDRQEADLDEKILSFEMMVETNPDKNIYVFLIESIEYSGMNPLNPVFPYADAGRALAYFMENKPEELIFDTLPLTNFDDQLNNFFRTDHHWNAHGLMKGYQRVYNMMARNYPGISPMLDLDKIHTFPDIQFHGSLARTAFFQINPGDVFEVPNPDMPSYEILDVDGKPIAYNRKDEYFSGNISTAPFTDHYIEFFGKDTAFLHYVFDNDAERNLLIIGDSYTNAIEPLIASHYHHTYSIDIRYFPDYYFSLSEFLSQYEVDDILVLGGQLSVFSQWRWTISP